MAKKLLLKLFEAYDGRSVSSNILFVGKDERVHLYSQGWCVNADGSSCDDITVYRFIHYPDDPKCEDPIIAVWTKDVNVDACSTVEIARIRLTKENTHDIIDEQGQYILIRECGASEVNVYAKFDSRDCPCPS